MTFVKVSESGRAVSKANRVITNERGHRIEVEVRHSNDGYTAITVTSPGAFVNHLYYTTSEAKAIRDALIEALTV